MDTFLLFYTLVLGYLSFTVLSWLSRHVKVFEESYQVRWCGGQSVLFVPVVVGASRGGSDLAGDPE